MANTSAVTDPAASFSIRFFVQFFSADAYAAIASSR
jgi:hypothetical protein